VDNEKMMEGAPMRHRTLEGLTRNSTKRSDFLSDLVGQLVHRRKELGLTQSDVDVIMGNSDRLCSKWECGMRTPTGFNLYCWADALDSSLQLGGRQRMS
jgi:DNA-binding transcriptional regulator YiaG